MKKHRRMVLSTLFVVLLGIMSTNCAPPDPSSPALGVVTPEQGAVFSADQLPYTYNIGVEFSGSVLAEYAITSQSCTLWRVNDGAVESGSDQSCTLTQSMIYNGATGKNQYGRHERAQRWRD